MGQRARTRTTSGGHFLPHAYVPVISQVNRTDRLRKKNQGKRTCRLETTTLPHLGINGIATHIGRIVVCRAMRQMHSIVASSEFTMRNATKQAVFPLMGIRAHAAM